MKAKVMLVPFLRGALDVINYLARTGRDGRQKQEGQRQGQSMALRHKDWREGTARTGVAPRAPDRTKLPERLTVLR